MPSAPAALIVYYDDTCGLCRRLAEYGRNRSEGRLDFVAWQAFAASPEAEQLLDAAERSAPPAHLRTSSDGMVLEDQHAWSAILLAYPPFEKYAWLAERIGFLGAISGVTYHGAKWLRRRCFSCR